MADYGTAFREAVATEERAAFALPYDELALFAFVTCDAGRFRRRGRGQGIALFIQLEDGFAFRVIAAAEKFTEPAGFINHFAAAVGTFVLADFLLDHFAFPVAGTCEGTLGIFRAAQETAVLAEPIHHRGVTFRAGIFTGTGFRLGMFHLLCCLFEIILERSVKFL